MRYFSTSLFIIGCVSFSVFVSINIYNENVKSKEKQNHKSIKIKTKNAEIIIDSIKITKSNDTLIVIN